MYKDVQACFWFISSTTGTKQMNVKEETCFTVKKETYSSDKLISILSWLMRQRYSNINKTSVKAVVIISIANTDSGLTTFTGFVTLS